MVNDLPAILPEATKNKWSPKLTFADQCAIYALHHRENVLKSSLAAAFGLHKKTVGFICNSNSPHYKRVRQEVERHGLDQTYSMYVTKRHIEIVNEAARIKKPMPMLVAPDKSKGEGAGIWIETKRGKLMAIWTESYGMEGWHAKMTHFHFLGRGSNNEPFATAQDCIEWWSKVLNRDLGDGQ